MPLTTVSGSLDIDTNDRRLRSAMTDSFERTAQGKVGLDSLYDEFKLLRSKAWTAGPSKRERDPHLCISYQGKRISFEFSTENFKYSNDKLASFAMYDSTDKHSNETYSNATIEDISGLKGIDSVLVVSGGLTQQLLKVGVLQENNDIRSVTLVDQSEKQLIYNMLQLIAYDAMPERFSAAWHVSGAERGSIRVEEGTTFRLAESSIIDAVADAGSGRYFIDSSNIYNMILWVVNGTSARHSAPQKCEIDSWWEDWWPSGYQFLQTLAGNPNIASGSVYMAASVGSSRAIIQEKRQEKRGSRMLEYSYCDGTEHHRTCVHPSISLRK